MLLYPYFAVVYSCRQPIDCIEAEHCITVGLTAISLVLWSLEISTFATHILRGPYL